MTDAPGARSPLDNYGQRVDRLPASEGLSWRMPAPAPPSYEISTAPRVPGVPLLLWTRGGGHWRLGYWDGMAWCDDAGFIVDPTHWAPLPGPPAAPMSS